MLKDAPLHELMECICAVVQGKRWVPPAVAAMLGKRVADRGLTARELEVIRELSKGKCNKEIGTYSTSAKRP